MSYMLTTAENELGVVIATSDAGTATCDCLSNDNTNCNLFALNFYVGLLEYKKKRFGAMVCMYVICVMPDCDNYVFVFRL